MINVTNENKQRSFSVKKLKLKVKKNRVLSINQNTKLTLDINNITLNINNNDKNNDFINQKQIEGYNKIPEINKLKYLNYKILQNLRSSELKGNYYHHTFNSINSIQTKRSYFEEENIPKSDNHRFKIKNQKKFFLTTSKQKCLLNFSNNVNDTTNIKTLKTLEIENYENYNEEFYKKNEKLKINNYSSIDNTLSKRTIESENIISPIKKKKYSINDKLFLNKYEPEEYYKLNNSKDKYIKFRKQIQKNKLQNYKKNIDGRLELIKRMGNIKKYHTKLVWTEYYLKTKCNSNYVRKFKKFVKL